MYEVCIYNNGVETLIHHPIPDDSVPHLKELALQEGISEINTLKFSIYPDNPGYELLYELKTYVKVIDTRDDSIRFTGRISDIQNNMDDIVYKEVECEGALTYLNDTKMRNEALLGSLSTRIQTILASHNSKVDDNKRIYLGVIAVASNDAYQCDYKSCLTTITDMKSKNNIGGDIRIREENGVLYLDWLTSFSSRTIGLNLGSNIQKMVQDKDMDSFGTRIIPLGANNLTIEDINGGIDYIEDLSSKSLYGVIEMTVSYSDITDAQELYDTCLADIQDGRYTQPTLTLTTTALDLSYLTGEKTEEFELGSTLHIVNPLLGIDANYKIVKLSLNLLEPYNPDVTISADYETSTDIINDTRNSSISNNSVHNGVQVGDDFGIRVSSSDGKVIITINALEGISIENVVDDVKKFFLDVDGNVNMVDGYIRLTRGDITINIDPQVGIEIKKSNTQIFYIDTSGNLIMDGIQKITRNGKVIIENTFNAYGGLNNIYDTNGNLILKLGVEAGTSDNTGATLIGYNKDSNKPRFRLGIAKDGDFGVLQLLNSNGVVKVVANADDNNGNGVVFIVDSYGISRRLATEAFVLEHMSTGGGE